HVARANVLRASAFRRECPRDAARRFGRAWILMELDQRAEMHTIKPWRAFFPIIDSSAVETSFEKIPFANRGVGLDAMAAGPKDGPVAVLLHGFPEFWYGWRKQIDRKSTRLNSSHGSISYAVFCLK